VKMLSVGQLESLAMRAFSESPWHSLLSALKGISEKTFFFVPQQHRGFPWMDGSIRDIVYHVTGDKIVQLSAAFGGGKETWDSLASKLSKSDMAKMMRELHDAFELERSKLKSLSDDELEQKVTTWGGKRMKACDLFLMLIEHDLYHAGQIRYIRNVIE
jgi:uncharacterized damage-inducible protein DinB